MNNTENSTTENKPTFLLEEYLSNHIKNLKLKSEDGQYENIREIERLVAIGKLNEAFDLYESDGYADEPHDFDEFVASYISNESKLD